MANYELANMFERLADIQEILEMDEFKIKCNRNVAEIVSGSVEDFSILCQFGQLEDIVGIGPSTAAKIKEYFEHGSIEEYDHLREQLPDGLMDLLKIRGLGAKSVGRIWRELKVGSLDQLRRAASDGRLSKLDGFGKKKADSILSNIDFLFKSDGKMNIASAIAIEADIQNYVMASELTTAVYPVGSLRRCCEIIGDIDLLAITDKPAELFDYIEKLEEFCSTTERKDNQFSFSWLERGYSKPCEVEIFTTDKDSRYTALCFLTAGAKQRELLAEKAAGKKLTFNAEGLFKGEKKLSFKCEADVYKKLGLPYILPTLQDNTEAQEAAIAKKLPTVVQLADIRGDLHMHTTDSDGRNDLEEMVAAAIQKKYEYICVTDHSKSSAFAHGLSIDKLKQQIEMVKEYNSRCSGLEVLAGSEVDILSDGSLDYDNGLLAELDYAVASIHNGLEARGPKNTTRILKAMENPYIKCICHPTGRYIKFRKPMDLDMERIFQQAVDTDTALEVSSQPARLDLSSEHIRQAIEMGVKLIINTDSHDIANLNLMALGVATAQKGWAAKENILNTLPWKKLKKWIDKGK